MGASNPSVSAEKSEVKNVNQMYSDMAKVGELISENMKLKEENNELKS